MQLLLISKDESFTAIVKKEANALGHLVVSSGSVGEMRSWGENVDLLLVDFRGVSRDAWEGVCSIGNHEDGRCHPYVIGFVDGEDMGVESGVVGGLGLDDLFDLPLSPSEIAEVIIGGGDGLEKRCLSEVKMNDSFAALLEEHLLLDEMGGTLLRIQDRVDGGIPYPVIAMAVRIIRLFDSDVHHAKEKMLFDVLVNRVSESGDNWALDLSENSFIDIEEEHEKLNDMFGDIGSALLQFMDDQEGSREVLKSSISEYVSFLRRHMDREEETIFPFAEERLLEGDRCFLSKEFLSIHENVGRKVIKRDLAGMQDLLEE